MFCLMLVRFRYKNLQCCKATRFVCTEAYQLEASKLQLYLENKVEDFYKTWLTNQNHRNYALIWGVISTGGKLKLKRSRDQDQSVAKLHGLVLTAFFSSARKSWSPNFEKKRSHWIFHFFEWQGSNSNKWTAQRHSAVPLHKWSFFKI